MAINFFHGDCMEYMKDKPDGYYDLAVADCPVADRLLLDYLTRDWYAEEAPF